MELNESMSYMKTEIQCIFFQLQHGSIHHNKRQNVSLMGRGSVSSSYRGSRGGHGYGSCGGIEGRRIHGRGGDCGQSKF